MSGKPTIHVIATGGTISGAGSSAAASAYESGRVEASELVAEVEGCHKFRALRPRTCLPLVQKTLVRFNGRYWPVELRN